MNQEKSYHHGDLRRALLEAAFETIRIKGAAGLTLRGVARAANVSHTAPYHHFKDKEALLVAVAEEGFRALRKSVEARSAAAESPALVLQEAAVAYVLFAVEHPELFRMMFGSHLSDKTAYPALQAASQAAYRIIGEGLKSYDSSGEGSHAQAEHLAVAAWAVTHGLAMLLIDQQFGLANTIEAEHLARQITDVFWVGLSRYSAGLDSGSSG